MLSAPECCSLSVNANNSAPFFSSEGGVAACKAVYNMSVLMDVYVRADNLMAWLPMFRVQDKIGYN